MSRRREQQIENLQHEQAKELADAVEGVYQAVAEVSDVVARAPREFVEGRFDRTFREDEGLQTAWRSAQEGDRSLLNTYVSRLTADLESNIDRLHSDPTPDDTAGEDDNARHIAAIVKEKAGLPQHFPSALVLDFLESECNHDPNSSEIAERARNPVRFEMMLNNAAHGLRGAANKLIDSTRPEPEIPFGLQMSDMEHLSDRDWARVKAAGERRTQLATKRR